MADLVGSIINYFATGTNTQAVALQALLPAGRMKGDFISDLSKGLGQYPYVVVTELHWEKQAESGGGLYSRMDKQTIQFEAFHNSAAIVDQLLSALEACYLHAPFLPVDLYSQVDRPVVVDRMKFRELDNWRGVLNLAYGLQKSPQGA